MTFPPATELLASQSGKNGITMPPAPINLLGIQVHPVTVQQVHQFIEESVRYHKHHLVLNVNVHCINLSFNNGWLRDFLNSAPLVFCDGAGVRWGAKLLGEDLPERITYADWMWELAAFAEAQNCSFFFLGGEPGVADSAAVALKKKHPGLTIHCQHGYFDKTKGSPENEAVIRKINDSAANILVMGLGMPLQEKWLMENWDRIDANIALTGGAVFDYVSGKLARAPRWMTDNGMEWLGRLWIEPGRLWQRYLLGNPIFIWRVFLQKMRMLQV